MMNSLVNLIKSEYFFNVIYAFFFNFRFIYFIENIHQIMKPVDNKDLELRPYLYKKIQESNQVPVSTLTRIIIPCKQRTFGYKTAKYIKNADLLERHIDRVQFDEFVNKANGIIDGELLNKNHQQTAKFFCWTFFYLKISIFIGICTFLLLATVVYNDLPVHDQKFLMRINFTLVALSVTIASACPIYLYLKKYPAYNYIKNIAMSLNKLQEQENQKLALEGKQHLKWKFDKNYFWISLEINDQVEKGQAFKRKTFKLVHSPRDHP